MALSLVVIASLNLAATLAILALELPHRVARRRRQLRRSFVDEGIALAERHARLHKGLSSTDKLHLAVGWATERCTDNHVKATQAELSKLVEIRLQAGSDSNG